MSGLLPSPHGAHNEHLARDDRHPTLAELLASSGYETLNVTANAWVGPGTGMTRGFQRNHESWRSYHVDFMLLAKRVYFALAAPDRDKTWSSIPSSARCSRCRAICRERVGSAFANRNRVCSAGGTRCPVGGDTRRRYPAWVIRRVAALLFGLPMLACSATAPGTEPNIVIVLVDDVGSGQLGYNGDTYHQTPNIDRLAAEGLVMSNAYAASPLCSPTRASLLTGRHPARLHLTLPLAPDYDGPKFDASHAWQRGAPPRNFPLVTPVPLDRLASEEVTLAERFADAGWATGLVGKWHLGSTSDTRPGKQGFGAFVAVGYMSGPWTYFPPYGVQNLGPLRPGEYLTDRLTREAVGFIEAHADEPFFLLLSHFAIHAPFEAKQELLAHYEARTQGRASKHRPVVAAMLQSVDESVGAVLATLERLALDERTLVLFVSDNGASTGRGKRRANAPLRGGKASLWEGGIRVPLVLRWPGVIAPEGRSELPVSSVDLFPTLLDLAGLSQDPDQPLDGRSFASLVKGGEAPEPRPLYFHHPHYAKLGPAAAVRDGSLKLVRFFGGKRFLYDLDRDPGERRNLAARRTADADRLEAELYRWLDEVGAQLPRPNPDYDPTRPRR